MAPTRSFISQAAPAIAAVLLAFSGCSGQIEDPRSGGTGGPGPDPGPGAGGTGATGGGMAGQSGSGGSGTGGRGGSGSGGSGGIQGAGGQGAGPGVGMPCPLDVAHAPLRRLSANQYLNTVQDLLDDTTLGLDDVPSDERTSVFINNSEVAVTDLQVEQYMSAAEGIAARAIPRLDTILPCPATEGEPCARKFIADFAARAYRRPLSDAEVADLLTIHRDAAAKAGFAGGIKTAISAVLQSPYFIYHVEWGDAPSGGQTAVPLTSYEIAARLSFFFWDSIPDGVLRAAAAKDALRTPEAVAEQARRLVMDPRAREIVSSFHTRWLELADLPGAEKDTTIYPAWTAQIRNDMVAETTRFVEHVVMDGDARVESLLTAPYSFLTDALAKLYEAPAVAMPGQRTELDPARRSGILTHASVLSAHSHQNQTSPVHRGKLIRENLLCQELSGPPDDVDDTPPALNPNQTTRERFAEHRTNPACASCHSLMDPIGFGFENYDGIGRYRAMEGKLPVDASGEISSSADADGPFVGVVDLAKRLSGSRQVKECVATQWFRFALRRTEGDGDRCGLTALAQAFSGSSGGAGMNIRDLLVALPQMDAFRHRKVN